MTRIVAAAGVVLLAILAVNGGTPRGSGLDGRYPDGLRLGYAVEAPYAFVDATGRVTGAIPEVAREVARRLDLPVTFVQSDFGALLNQLEEGRYDVVASGLFITPARAKRVRFSVPSFQTTDAALVTRGNPKQLHSLDDVRAKGATVVVLAASVEEVLARAAGISATHTIVVPDAAGARRALESGRADVLLNSEPNVHWTAAHEAAGAFEVAAPFEIDRAGGATLRLGAFAFRQGDEALVAAWNRVLADFVGTPDHLTLIEPFGFTRRSLPPALDTASGRTAP